MNIILFMQKIKYYCALNITHSHGSARMF